MFKLEIENRIIPLEDIRSKDEDNNFDILWNPLFDLIKNWDKQNQFRFLTSGSTGTPKEIIFNKSAIQASINITAKAFNLEESSRVFLPLPLEYVAGKMMVYRAIQKGWQLHTIPPTSDPTDQMSETYDFAAFVPLQIENIINKDPNKLRAIKNIIIGGAPLSERLKERLRNIPSNIYQTYGMTETLTHIAIQKISSPNSTEYFELLDGFDIAVTPNNQLSVYAPHIQDKAILTNDIVQVIDQKRFILKGRIDRVINSGGIKIQAELVEAKIDELLDRPFYICGETDERLGQKVVLKIEGEPLDSVTFSLLKSCLKESLSSYENPKMITFVKQFDRTKSGKIIRTK